MLTNCWNCVIIRASKGTRAHEQEEDETMMKVKELMEMLEKMDGEMEVRFAD